MTIPTEFKGRYFYHFTHIENLESIVKNGFLSTNEKKAKGLKHTNVAYESIQHRRSEMDVTCDPSGKVHDYVPFYFATTNPMLLSITNRKNIDQPFLIFIAVSIDRISDDNVIFTDASANTAEPPFFYNSPDDLDKLDWTAIDKTKWGCSSDDERHKRMAEALVYKEVPLDWIDRIIVWNDDFKEETIRIFKENNKGVPNVGFSPFNWRHFYFTKFQLNRDTETLVEQILLRRKLLEVSNLGGSLLSKIQRLSYEKKVTPSLKRRVKMCLIFLSSTKSFTDQWLLPEKARARLPIMPVAWPIWHCISRVIY